MAVYVAAVEADLRLPFVLPQIESAALFVVGLTQKAFLAFGRAVLFSVVGVFASEAGKNTHHREQSILPA